MVQSESAEVDCESKTVSKKTVQKLEARIRDLEAALGRKTLHFEFL